VGEKVPLDGELISDSASLNSAAITGESKPQSLLKGEKVMAGSINLESVIEVKVEKLFNDSSVAKILNLVQNATAKKAKTELLIRRLAKIYTPIVVYLAIGICFVPY
jgi:Cd2+/Zn2+-exporting ATPase